MGSDGNCHLVGNNILNMMRSPGKEKKNGNSRLSIRRNRQFNIPQTYQDFGKRAVLGNEQRVNLLANFTVRAKDCFYQGGYVRASGAQFLMSEWSSLARSRRTDRTVWQGQAGPGRQAGRQKMCVSSKGYFTEKRGQFGKKAKL